MKTVLRNLVTDFLPKRTPRTLHLRERLQLGDRQYVALIECDGQRFLIGASTQSLNLIANLKGQE